MEEKLDGEMIIIEAGLDQSPTELYEAYVQEALTPPVSQSLWWRFVRWRKFRCLDSWFDYELKSKTLTPKEQHEILGEGFHLFQMIVGLFWAAQCILVGTAVARFLSATPTEYAEPLYAFGALFILSAVAVPIILVMTSGGKEYLFSMYLKRHLPRHLRNYLILPLMPLSYLCDILIYKQWLKPNARLENEEAIEKDEIKPMTKFVTDRYQEGLKRLHDRYLGEQTPLRKNQESLQKNLERERARVLQFRRLAEQNTENREGYLSVIQRSKTRIKEIERAIQATEQALTVTRAVLKSLETKIGQLQGPLLIHATHAEMDREEAEHSQALLDAEHSLDAHVSAIRADLLELHYALLAAPSVNEETEALEGQYIPALEKIGQQLAELSEQAELNLTRLPEAEPVS